MNVGNTGDQTAGTVSASIINGMSGVMAAGSVAGTASVTLTISGVVSNTITTQIYGVPTKMVHSPNTLASVIPGARGEYFFNSPGVFLDVLVLLQDSSGHSTPFGEWAGHTSTATIQALTGGSITPGGSNVTTFRVTGGNTDGLFTITYSGSWTGANGGSGPINISRDTGHNAN